MRFCNRCLDPLGDKEDFICNECQRVQTDVFLAAWTEMFKGMSQCLERLAHDFGLPEEEIQKAVKEYHEHLLRRF